LNGHKIATAYITGCQYQKLPLLNRDFFAFVPENELVIYYDQSSHRQPTPILKADFCIFDLGM